MCCAGSCVLCCALRCFTVLFMPGAPWLQGKSLRSPDEAPCKNCTQDVLVEQYLQSIPERKLNACRRE